MADTPIRDRNMPVVNEALATYVKDVETHCDEMERAVRKSRNEVAKKLEAYLNGPA